MGTFSHDSGGSIVGGDAFPGAVVAKTYAAGNLSFRFAWDDLAGGTKGLGWVPAMELTVTRTSGLFVDSLGRSIRETFCGIRLTWTTVTAETWNDLCAHKDKGPTFGVRLFVRSIAFSISDWIK